MTADNLRKVRVKRISHEAESINSYELVHPERGDLAPFTAGSHIDLHLQNGMIRSYSLVNDQSETTSLPHRSQRGRVRPRRLKLCPRHRQGWRRRHDLYSAKQLSRSTRRRNFPC